MNVFYSSDHHFGHKNIIKYCKRYFCIDEDKIDEIENCPNKEALYKIHISDESIEKMNITLINNINNTIGKDDLFYCIGDIFTNKDKKRMRELRDMINCENIILIKGNHDPDYCEPFFTKVHHLITVNHFCNKVTLCHYPLRSWIGTYMFYGHEHAAFVNEDKLSGKLTRDIGVDCNDYYPFSHHEAIKIGSVNISK